MDDATIHTSDREPFWRHAHPFAIISTLWKHRELIGQLTRREIDARYKGAYLGLLWTLLTPLSMLSVYTFVFGSILNSRWDVRLTDSMFEFSVVLFCGLIFFTIFSETVVAATRIVVINPNFVKRVVFPLEILPVTCLGAALIQAFLSGLIFMAGLVVFVRIPPLTIFYFPLVLFSLCAFTLGISWFVAALGVFIRDISHSVMILTQIILFCSAVFYPVSLVPKRLAWIIQLNPIASFVTDCRKTIIYGQSPDWKQWAMMTAISLVLLQVGYLFFIRSKRAFSDVL